MVEEGDSLTYQRSRVRWFKEGDANTSFFHACVKRRKRSNAVLTLKVDDGWMGGKIIRGAEGNGQISWSSSMLDGLEFQTLKLKDCQNISKPFLV